MAKTAYPRHRRAFWLVGEVDVFTEPGTAMNDNNECDTWDDPKYLKPSDCDESGYCAHCGTATVHRVGCIVLAQSRLT
ncbi:hypothetical protein ACNQR7_31115 [Mycolicibacterium senegalense]|uniref:hypothetical protein n=1 Tax=Mycolicibacterium senegalense TaxID=1796 RepID=UPI003AAE6E99